MHLCSTLSGRTATFFYRATPIPPCFPLFPTKLRPTLSASSPTNPRTSRPTATHLHRPTCARAAPQLRIFTDQPVHEPRHSSASSPTNLRTPAPIAAPFTYRPTHEPPHRYAPPPPRVRTFTRLSPVEPPLSSMEHPHSSLLFLFSQGNCAPLSRTFTHQPVHEPRHSSASSPLHQRTFALLSPVELPLSSIELPPSPLLFPFSQRN